MAGSFNQVILLGNLTRDVELKYTPTNVAIANLGIACNRTWVGQDGQKKEEVTFIDLEAYGKQAEVMAKFLAKGRPVFIQGRLKLDQWQDKNDGSKRSKLKVVVEAFQFVDSRGGAGGGGGSAGDEMGGDSPAPRVQTRGATSPRAAAASAPEINEEDIPF